MGRHNIMGGMNNEWMSMFMTVYVYMTVYGHAMDMAT